MLDFVTPTGVIISVGTISNMLIKDNDQFHQGKPDLGTARLDATLFLATSAGSTWQAQAGKLQ